MRNFLTTAFLALILACTATSPALAPSAAEPASDAAAADAQTSEVASDAATGSDAPASELDSAVAEVAGLPETFGLQLDPVPLPAFSKVVDSNGNAVGADALLGHYTVLWFYPAAQTTG